MALVFLAAEHVALAPAGEDQRHVEALVDLVAKVADIHVNHVRGVFIILVVEVLPDHRPRDHAAAVEREELDERAPLDGCANLVRQLAVTEGGMHIRAAAEIREAAFVASWLGSVKYLKDNLQGLSEKLKPSLWTTEIAALLAEADIQEAIGQQPLDSVDRLFEWLAASPLNQQTVYKPRAKALVERLKGMIGNDRAKMAYYLSNCSRTTLRADIGVLVGGAWFSLDVVVTNPASQSCLASRRPDENKLEAAGLAERGKNSKYSRAYNAGNQLQHIAANLVPFALEVTGTLGKQADDFVQTLSKLKAAVPEANPRLAWARRFFLNRVSIICASARAELVKLSQRIQQVDAQRAQAYAAVQFGNEVAEEEVLYDDLGLLILEVSQASIHSAMDG